MKKESKYPIPIREWSEDDLFRTLLHQLMTAEIRLSDLDLSDLQIETPTLQPREAVV